MYLWVVNDSHEINPHKRDLLKIQGLFIYKRINSTPNKCHVKIRKVSSIFNLKKEVYCTIFTKKEKKLDNITGMLTQCLTCGYPKVNVFLIHQFFSAYSIFKLTSNGNIFLTLITLYFSLKLGLAFNTLFCSTFSAADTYTLLKSEKYQK